MEFDVERLIATADAVDSCMRIGWPYWCEDNAEELEELRRFFEQAVIEYQRQFLQ